VATPPWLVYHSELLLILTVYTLLVHGTHVQCGGVRGPTGGAGRHGAARVARHARARVRTRALMGVHYVCSVLLVGCGCTYHYPLLLS
jgi:hypothetical protein